MIYFKTFLAPSRPDSATEEVEDETTELKVEETQKVEIDVTLKQKKEGTFAITITLYMYTIFKSLDLNHLIHPCIICLSVCRDARAQRTCFHAPTRNA